MESQLELYNELMEYEDKFTQAVPGLEPAQTTISTEVYQDKALTRKVKRLMAMALAIRDECTACILAQTKIAIEAGATKDEILETMSVVYAMGGNTGLGHAMRVIKLLEELGEW